MNFNYEVSKGEKLAEKFYKELLNKIVLLHLAHKHDPASILSIFPRDVLFYDIFPKILPKKYTLSDMKAELHLFCREIAEDNYITSLPFTIDTLRENEIVPRPEKERGHQIWFMDLLSDYENFDFDESLFSYLLKYNSDQLSELYQPHRYFEYTPPYSFPTWLLIFSWEIEDDYYYLEEILDYNPLMNNEMLENYTKEEALENDFIFKYCYEEGRMSEKTLRYILKNLDLKTIDLGEKTPLMWAIENGDDETVQFLLEMGVDINERDKEGQDVFQRCEMVKQVHDEEKVSYNWIKKMKLGE